MAAAVAQSNRMTHSLPWTAAVAAGKAACILFAAYILWKVRTGLQSHIVGSVYGLKHVPLQVACGVTEWLRAYRILARQRIPKPPLLTAFKVHAQLTTAGTVAIVLDYHHMLVTSIGKK